MYACVLSHRCMVILGWYAIQIFFLLLVFDTSLWGLCSGSRQWDPMQLAGARRQPRHPLEEARRSERSKFFDLCFGAQFS
jgi:hypothetical protein